MTDKIANPFSTVAKGLFKSSMTEMVSALVNFRKDNRVACIIDRYDVLHHITVCGLKKLECVNDSVVLTSQARFFHASYGCELYAQVQAWHRVLSRTSSSAFPEEIPMLGHFSLYCGTTLIKRNDVTPLCVYGLARQGSVSIVYHPMLGGANTTSGVDRKITLLPTYTHVRECEEMLVQQNKLVVQSAERDTAQDRQFRAENNLYAMIGRWLGAGGIDGEFIEKLIEDLHIFMRLVVSAREVNDYTTAIISFLKFRTGKTLFSQRNLEAMIEYLSHLFDAEFETQSVEDVFSGARSYLDKYEELKKAPIFKKLYKLAMYALSFSVFDALGINFDFFKYSALEAEAIKRRYHMGADFVHTLLSTLLFVCERGYQCMKTGSLDPIYHSGSSYEQWFDKASLLKRRSVLLAFPEAHGFTLYEYLADLRESIEHGDAIYRHATRVGEFERKMVGSLVSDLKMILANQTTKREAQKERDAPFCVCLYGGSSIGKTTITDMLFLQYGKTFDLPLGSEFKYTHNPTAKYWDGFNSSQWFVIMDDIAFMHPNKASEGDPSVMETIQTNNRVAFVPDQAALEDKGRTPFRARCVVATTNCEDLNAVHYFQTPLAMQRRFPYTIDVRVKPEFSKDECMLDSSKTQCADGEWPNYWDFIIKRPVPSNTNRRGQRANLVEVERFTDVNDFLAWFSRVAHEHERVQHLVGDSAKSMAALEVCKRCFRTTQKCVCLEAQTNLTFAERCKKVALDGMIGLFKTQAFHTVASQALDMPPVRNRLEDLFVREGGVTERVVVPADEREWFAGSDDELHLPPVEEEFHDAESGGESDNSVFNTAYRTLFRKLGNVVHSSIGAPELIGTLIGACGVLLGAYKLYKLMGNPLAEQGNVSSKDIGRLPPKSDDRTENVWFRDDYALSSFDVSARVTSWNSLTSEQVAEKIAPNLVHISTDREVSPTRRARQDGRAVCVVGHIYMTNNHNLSVEGDLQLTIVTASCKQNGINQTMTILLTQDEITRYPAMDVCVFQLKCLPPRKDISDLFAKGCVKFKANGALLARNFDGEMMNVPVRALTRSGAQTNGADYCINDSWTYAPIAPTEKGDCGALVLGFTGMGPMIVGIHALGQPNRCFAACTVVTAEMVESFKALYPEPVVQCAAPHLSSASAVRTVGDLHEKSVFRYIEQGTANVYGSFGGFKQTPTSKVVPTLIQAAILEEGFEVKHDKPVMKGWEPWRRAAIDMVNPVTQMNKTILKECKDAFLQDILTGLPQGALDEVMVYDDVTALNGAAGVKFVDKMNRNTSMGNPWQKGKKYFLNPIPEINGLTEPVEFTQEIQDRINMIIDCYHAGERFMPNFCGHLKDEPVTFKKIKMAKTRVFLGGPGDWSFVVRKYLLSVIRLIQTNKFVFETAVGTNACSTEWQDIRQYLTQFGEESMVAGDYAVFDKTMPAEVILAAFDILREICKEAGYTADDLRVIQGIAEDTAFPLTDFNGDLVEFFGSNPSGHPLTVIINSLANSLYVRYGYRVVNPASEVRSFKRNVALMTYGDDNAMGVNSKFAPWFNHTTLQQVLASAGITYTMADKEAESIPYIPIGSVSFLKRTWRWDASVGAYLAPLEEDSISKSLTVCVRSKTLSAEYHAVAIMESAYAEYFFYGREIFELRAQMFKRIVEKYDLAPYVRDTSFPTWDELYDRFWASSPVRH